MVLYIGIYIESDWLYHAEWVALSNGQSGSELAEYSHLENLIKWLKFNMLNLCDGIIIPVESEVKRHVIQEESITASLVQ